MVWLCDMSGLIVINNPEPGAINLRWDIEDRNQNVDFACFVFFQSLFFENAAQTPVVQKLVG